MSAGHKVSNLDTHMEAPITEAPAGAEMDAYPTTKSGDAIVKVPPASPGWSADPEHAEYWANPGRLFRPWEWDTVGPGRHCSNVLQ